MEVTTLIGETGLFQNVMLSIVMLRGALLAAQNLAHPFLFPDIDHWCAPQPGKYSLPLNLPLGSTTQKWGRCIPKVLLLPMLISCCCIRVDIWYYTRRTHDLPVYPWSGTAHKWGIQHWKKAAIPINKQSGRFERCVQYTHPIEYTPALRGDSERAIEPCTRYLL